MAEKILSPVCGCCGGGDMLTVEEIGQIRDNEGYYCKDCIDYLTTPYRVQKVIGEPRYVTQMRAIVQGKSAAGVTDEKGRRLMCDSFTASVVTQVWDKLNDKMKEKLAALPMQKAIKCCWAAVK